MALLNLKKWEKAKADLTTATELQKNIVIDNFGKDYENVEDFEQKHNIKLPKDIAAMLTSS